MTSLREHGAPPGETRLELRTVIFVPACIRAAGEYEVELVVSADNAKPTSFKFKLHVGRQWKENDHDLAQLYRLVKHD